MKKIFSKVVAGALVLCMATLSLSIPSKADNPIVQNIYTADPAPMVSGDTLYLYTSHDEDKLVKNFYTMNDWKCYSTKDMVNWTDHGTVLSREDFKWMDTKDPRAWAPQCVERNGKYYMYVPVHKKNGGMVIGVGVSDKPTGPFVDAIGKPLVDEGDWNDIDPTVFIDDDGQAYLYFGNPNLRYVKLNEDMLSYDTTIGKKGIESIDMNESGFGPKVTENGKVSRQCSYGEGPWFYKRGSLYYMVYAAFGPKGGNEHLAYSTSKSPTGPWEYQDVIMPSQGYCYTNHPGVVDFMGHTYLYYHDQRLKGGGNYHRSVSVEEFKYNEDGTFPTLNMTVDGPAPIAKLDPYQWTEAETYAKGTNVESEGNGTVGMNLCDIKNGSTIKVKNVDFGEKSAVSFRAAIASEKKATMELHLDSAGGPLIGTLNIDNTGGEYIFKILSTDITNATGIHDLYMVFKGEDKVSLAKFDHWRFVDEKGADAIPDPTPKPTPVPTPSVAPTATPNVTETPAPTIVPSQTPALTQSSENKKIESPQPKATVRAVKKIKVAKVKGVKVTVTKAKKAKISWKKVKRAAGYRVMYSTDKKFKKAAVKITTKKANYVTKKLKKGKKYFIKVAAYRKDKAGKKVYGSFSAVKKIKVK